MKLQRKSFIDFRNLISDPSLPFGFLIDSLRWSLHIGKLKQIFVSPETEIETDMNNMAQYLMSISQLKIFWSQKKCQISHIEIKILNRYVHTFSPVYSVFEQICFPVIELIFKNWQNDQWSQCHSIQMPLMLLLLCIFHKKSKHTA